MLATALITRNDRRNGPHPYLPLVTAPPACQCAPASSGAQPLVSCPQSAVVSVESLPLEGAAQPSRVVEKADPRHVLILGGDHVYKMDYGEMLRGHLARKADVTIGCIPVPPERDFKGQDLDRGTGLARRQGP